MAYGPCLNPSCSSHGKPHPNCKCYDKLAKGGDVAFCSKDNKHDKDCQYYAEGDEVSQPDDGSNRNRSHVLHERTAAENAGACKRDGAEHPEYNSERKLRVKTLSPFARA